MVHHPRKAHPHEFSQSKFQSRIRHLQAAPRIRRPRGLVRGALQRRQVIASQQAHVPQGPREGFADARQDRDHQLLRRRRSKPRRSARLRLREGVEKRAWPLVGADRGLLQPGPRLRAGGVAHRHPPRAHRARPQHGVVPHRRRAALRHRADEGGQASPSSR